MWFKRYDLAIINRSFWPIHFTKGSELKANAEAYLQLGERASAKAKGSQAKATGVSRYIFLEN